MEWHSHDPVSSVESLFHPISMMNINIYVQDPLMVFQKLKDTQDNVIHITETGRLRLLCMMQATAPVNADFWRLE